MAGDGEAKVVRGASLLILLQVVSRAITFVANQVLLRFMTAQLLGISTQLEVYYLSVLFFARESLRVAIQRQGSIAPTTSDSDPPPPAAPNSPDQDGPETTSRETQAVVNLGYISTGLGLVVAALLGWMYLKSVPATTILTTPFFIHSVYIYALASVLELLSEPAFVVMQIRLQFSARATAESVATFGKCAVTLSSAVWASHRGIELGVLPFALGQTAYGLGLLGVYAWYGTTLAGRDGFSLLPRRLGGGGGGGVGGVDESPYFLSYFYRPTVKLASSMMVQSFVKHLLTQGDTFLVSILSTPTAQGVYALANNYGSLAARLVFQPVEESSRSYFSRLLSGADTPRTAPTSEKPQEDSDAPNSGKAAPPPPPPRQALPLPQQPSRPALDQASENLTSLLQVYALISLPLLALGPTAAPLVLSIIAGPKWTSSGAGDALAAYIYYIPLMAFNGLTEAFVASVATGAQVHRQSVWMTAFSLLFAAAGYIFMRVLNWGAVGLVWANGINMVCRILWAVWFIRGYFAARNAKWDIIQLLPSPLAVSAAAVTAQLVRRIAGSAEAALGVKAVMIELFKIAAVAVPFVGVLYVMPFLPVFLSTFFLFFSFNFFSLFLWLFFTIPSLPAWATVY